MEKSSISSSAFGPLSPLGDVMDLGKSEEPSPRDLVMFDPRVLSLKRAHSPPKPTKSSSPRLSPTELPSPSAMSALVQVSLFSPCMARELLGGVSKSVSESPSTKGSLALGVDPLAVTTSFSSKVLILKLGGGSLLSVRRIVVGWGGVGLGVIL